MFVDLFSEKKINYSNICFKFSKDKVLKLFPSEVELVFSSTISNLKIIKSSDFEVGFNYDSIDKGNKTAEIKLLNAPPTANNIRLNHKNVFF